MSRRASRYAGLRKKHRRGDTKDRRDRRRHVEEAPPEVVVEAPVIVGHYKGHYISAEQWRKGSNERG